jgi:hypothetical protein
MAFDAILLTRRDSLQMTQVHWFGNCGKGYTRYKKCCTNAAPLESGFDWNRFSKGNSCRGDNDRDTILREVNCWFFKSKGIKPGPWPQGMQAKERDCGIT